ncbi:MAG: ABC transporter permease subunit [Fervidobacterium sp.]
MRELRKLFVYFLLIIGTVVMIAPFAWMLVTSFKLPSEVNSWPPRWTTRSFASQRYVKVIPSTGTTSTVKGLSLREALTFVAKKTQGLVFVVNDDPFYRGTITIPLKGKTYAQKVDIQKFQSFLNTLKLPTEFSFSEDFKNNPDQFFESVLLRYISGSNPMFKRDTFMETLLGSIDTLLDGIDTILTFGVDRIEDKNEKEKFSAFLTEKTKQLQDLKTKLQKFKAGESLILGINELEEIRSILFSYDLTYTGANEVSDNYNSSIKSMIYKYLENIDFFLSTYKYFVSLQDKIVEKDIVAKPMTEDERKNLFLENVKDLTDFKLVKAILEKEGLMNLVDEFAKETDGQIIKKYNISGADLANIKSLISSVINTAMENKMDVQKELNSTFTDFMDKIGFIVGFNLTFSSASSKLRAYSQEIENSDELFKDIAIKTLELQKLRSAYESAVYAWNVVNAPDFVKSVLVKEGKNIEIVMDGVEPVYFMDDNIKTVHVKFSGVDVFKNVFQNYVLAWKAAPFGRYYLNTIFIATVTTVLEIIISAMAAYAFSWMNFPGKDILFSIFLATMMVPGEVLLVPNFITVTKLGWIDTYYALIVPWVVSVFSIFLMRQHFLSLPGELFDAAKIDGCSHWRFLWQIVVPLSKPVVITTALLKFVGSWNSFLWVLIVTNSPKYRTLTVGLQTFSSEVGTLYNMLMAAATFSILPVVIIFLFTQKYFVKGIARTGLK